jgi:hypothetical protein
MLTTHTACHVCNDPWLHVTRDMVREAVGQWLGIPWADVDVKFFLRKGFCYCFLHQASKTALSPLTRALASSKPSCSFLSWTPA